MKRPIYFVLFCVGVLGLNMASSSRQMDLDGTYVEVQRKDAMLTVPVQGVIVPESHRKIESSVDGVVQSILVEVGSQVQKGQILMEISNDSTREKIKKLNMRILELKDEVASKKIKFNRDLLLFKQKLISRPQLDRAHVDFLDIEKQLEIFQEDLRIEQGRLDGMRIVAPISGVVSNVYVSASNDVVQDDVLFEITNLGKYVFRGQVGSAALEFLEIDQDAMIKCELLPGQEIKGRVLRKSLGENEITVDIVNSHELKLAPNLEAEAQVVISRVLNGIVIPRKAIINGPQGPAVFSKGLGGWLKKVPIKVSELSLDQGVISEGLMPGQLVLVPKNPT